jgi:hypothetical protein
MTVLVEMRQERLPRRFEKRRGILDERDAHLMRAGRNGHTNLQRCIDGRVVAVGGHLNRHRFDERPVNEHEQLVRCRRSEAANAAGSIAREPDLDVVLAIVRERVRRRHPAARANREPGHVLFLREIGGYPDHVGLRGCRRPADRQPADLLRGRDVAVQERGGEIADGDVVEAVTAVVRRQKRRGVDVEGQKISDRVLILRPVEPT